MNSKYLAIVGLSLSILAPGFANAGKSNLRAMLPYVSEVKDQKGRNTCTIQTTIAMLETYYIKHARQNINLSEEWLQYLAAVTNQSGGAKGSMVQTDVNNALRWGVPTEATLPYTYGEWKGKEKSASDMCGHLANQSNKLAYTRCLYGKFPANYISMTDANLESQPGGSKFASARTEAKDMRSFFSTLRPRVISKNNLKAQLDANKSVALEVNLFHGSWNTAVASQKGMRRDNKLYKNGIVTYPEVGSLDRKISPTLGNRHAVQIVGYDDDVEVTYTINMEDGKSKTFKRKGVYIFKNSWGTRDFGRNFTYDKMRIRGFGMILQDHVHEFGKLTVFE